MKKFLLSLFVCVICSLSFAQQIPQFSQWYLNQMTINPAHAGIKQCAEINAIYRAQFVGVDGAPKSSSVSFAAPIPSKRKSTYSMRHGFGLNFENDQIAQFVANRLNVNYAAHLNFDQNRRISVGISGGFQQWSFDKGATTTTQPDIAINQYGSFVKPNAAVGIWWNSVNYYLGASATQLPRNVWENISDNSRFGIHTYLNAGFRKMVNETFTLLPVILVRIPPAGRTTSELVVTADWNNKFALGLGYRTSSAILASIQLKMFNYVSVVYSFDYGINALSMTMNQTHEVGLHFSSCRSNSKETITSCPLF